VVVPAKTLSFSMLVCSFIDFELTTLVVATMADFCHKYYLYKI
jgi:hypothetical protein